MVFCRWTVGHSDHRDGEGGAWERVEAGWRPADVLDVGDDEGRDEGDDCLAVEDVEDVVGDGNVDDEQVNTWDVRKSGV